ncbi:MAG: 4Fe-4S dicluster domain-containing protein [Betaproteobacteria bacterium]|nr:4Fe-4S dicluster domain-containing protein [Betaproteobacteria bacterium]
MKQETISSLVARRAFLRKIGRAATCAGAIATAGALGVTQKVAAKSEPASSRGSFPTPDYDWTKRRWGFGVDATKCIGCLRCVEACKRENNVPADAHHFNTWVERYVYLEGEAKARVDSQADPQNVAASGSEKEYRFDNRYQDSKVEKAFFVPKLCNQCEHPPCVQVCPTGATYKTKDGVVLIDSKYCIGCQYCVQACPYGARYFNVRTRVTQKCYWCYHRITKGLQPACVEACPVGARIFGDRNDPQSPISLFIRNNRVQVLRPETGNAPNVFYVGIDKEVG